MDSPGQNTGVGSHSSLQGTFPTQEWNQGLLPCRRILYQLSHQGRPSSCWGWTSGCPGSASLMKQAELQQCWVCLRVGGVGTRGFMKFHSGLWPPVFGDVSDKEGGCGLDDPGGRRLGSEEGTAWPPLGPRSLPAWSSRAMAQPGASNLAGPGPHFSEGSRDPSRQRAAFLLAFPVREGAVRVGNLGSGGALEALKARPRCLLLGFLRGALGPIPRCPRKCRGPSCLGGRICAGKGLLTAPPSDSSRNK